MERKKYTYDVRVRYVDLFVMLDTSQIVAPFIPLTSQNIAHSCELAALKSDFCYEILKQLLGICVCTKTSVKFQAIHHPVPSVS